MPDKDAGTPRVYIARHGETEWSQKGYHTGTTDVLLTANGEDQVRGTGAILFGPGKLIDPSRLARIYVSPLTRAQRTLDLFFEHRDVAAEREKLQEQQRITTTTDLTEWNYGLYEGLPTKAIRDQRASRGLDKERGWEIWIDGCESGESPQDVTDRLDRLIGQIRKLQAPCMNGEQAADVLLVAHGHILRAFTKRWLNLPMGAPLSMMLEPGAIGVLSYQHHSLDEPAVLLGTSLPLSGKK